MPLAADLTVKREAFVLRATFEVADGETLALLGPNGAGKSTVVAALAGLEPLASGPIELDGRRIDARPPGERGVGVAFQDGLLLPHLSALDNVAFPLRARRAGRHRARARAAELLERLAPGVDPAARPAVLSGGERQRVALARAVATEPRLLLLDEPLSAVDVSAKAELRSAIAREIRAFAGPCVLVAHDPIDALTLADRIAIIDDGKIVQTGTPAEIRAAPTTPYAADLVGVNLYAGRLEPAEGGAGRLATPEGALTVAWPEERPHATVEGVLATLRPSDVSLHLHRPEGSPRNVLEGPVAEVAVHGERARVRVGSAPPVIAEVTLGSVERLGLREGVRVFASWKAVEVHLVLPDEPGRLAR
ncbi:MAG: ABC transporter ATP-binding protein [Planctomycetaceae bacterium]